MVGRHQEIDFSSGALVFPGGKVDAQDADAAWADLAPDSAQRARSRLRGGGRARDLRGGGAGAGAAGGYASHAGCGGDASVGRDLSRAFARGRDDLPRYRALRGALARHRPDGALCALDHAGAGGQALRYAFPAGGSAVEQLGAHDGGESVEGFWIAPRQALPDAEAGAAPGPADADGPQQAVRHASVAEAVAATRAGRIVTVTPRIERAEGGRKLHIPAEAGYGVTEALVPVRGQGQ